MRQRRFGTTRQSISVAAGALWLLSVDVAQASAAVPTPPGWLEGRKAGQEARQRAKDWAHATGYRLLTVASPVDNDDFAETLAVLEIDEPLRLWPLEQQDHGFSALMRAIHPLLGDDAEPDTFSVDRQSDQTAVLRGRWVRDETVYYAALAPSGPTQTLVVMVAKTAEHSLYGPVFDEAAAGLEGIAAPMAPFPQSTWRAGVAAAWLFVVGLVYAVIATTTEHPSDRSSHARRTAVVTVMLAVLASLVTWAALDAFAATLAMSNLSREWLAAETALLGLGLASVLRIIAARSGRTNLVQSAPMVGVFAGKNTGQDHRLPRLYDPTGIELVKVPPRQEPIAPSSPPKMAPIELAVAPIGDEPPLATRPAAAPSAAMISAAGPSQPPPKRNAGHNEAGAPNVMVIEDRTPVPKEAVDLGPYSLGKRK